MHTIRRSLTGNTKKDKGGVLAMEKQNMDRKEERSIAAAGACNKEQALRTIDIIEKGARHAFLDGDVSAEDTMAILDRVREAKERCTVGDANACQILTELVNALSEGRSGSI